MFRLGSEREVAFLDREEHFMHFLSTSFSTLQLISDGQAGRA
jgi:hypothetical protein